MYIYVNIILQQDKKKGVIQMIEVKGKYNLAKIFSDKIDEKLLIPINMRDGSILAIGKGNEDWNYSAPHGAGRLMSRSEAKSKLNINEFENSMKDIWTTSVCEETIDEAPMAYKSIDDILKFIGHTVEIIDVIKPIYNYKSK